jgi:hypothetical protein
MVLTKPELMAALQKEVRILTHLAGKLDPSHLDYRPTSKQRSSLELLQYLSFMGPQIVAAAKGKKFDGEAWGAAAAAAAKQDLKQTMAVIAKQPEVYEQLLADMSDQDFRSELTGFDGNKISAGAFIVNVVLGGYAAYRTQLFCYLKSCGREELSTPNLWRGVDAQVPA